MRNHTGMSRYRRLYVPGGTYFFTGAIANRGASTLVDEIDLLRSVYGAVVAQHPVICEAMVVLPDHIHVVWTLPKGDTDFSTRWRKIKGVFRSIVPLKERSAQAKPDAARKVFGNVGFGNMRSVIRSIFALMWGIVISTR